MGKQTNRQSEEVFILADEEGNESEFRFANVLNVEGREYAVLLPVDENDDGCALFRIDYDSDGDGSFVDIVDPSEFDAVAIALSNFLDELFAGEGGEVR